jgi:hypothetical protein
MQGSAYRLIGVVGNGYRSPKFSHDAIADIFINNPPLLQHNSGHFRQIVIQQMHELSRGQPF